MTKLDLKQQLQQTGALQFDAADVPLSQTQWLELESISQQVNYEHIIGGDAGEGHSVHVSRFINDVTEPVDLQPIATRLKAITMSETMLRFYQRFTGTQKLCLRRCQANLLKTDDFIGKHIDQHSNPDYFASVVFHFDSAYEGGDFISQPDSIKKKTFHPVAHSVVINAGHVWHEVKPVSAGERRTLACFLSTSFGKSRRPRLDFDVSYQAGSID